MTAFTQFWLKTCINIKYLKKPEASSLESFGLVERNDALSIATGK